MRNVKFNHKKVCFTFCLLKQRQLTKQNKTKMLLKCIKVFNLPTANHVNSMQPMLVSYNTVPEGVSVCMRGPEKIIA